MVTWDRKTLLGFMFLLEGTVAISVNYPAPVCAVKGSTVTLLCTFRALQSARQGGEVIKIIRVRWCKNHLICQGSTPSVYDSDSKTSLNPRYKYLGDKVENCTLQITDVQKIDEATLRFRMEANDDSGHYTGQSGVTITVADPTVRINSSTADRALSRGDNATLYCSARCSLHQLTVNWFKEGRKLPESGPALQLHHVTAEDSGNYTCSLNTRDSQPSPPYSLQVKPEEDHLSGSDSESGNLALVVSVTFGVLLAVLTLIVVLIIFIRRLQAVDNNQGAAGGGLEHKHADDVYSNIPKHAEPGLERCQQETSQAVDNVSYASIHFQHKSPARLAVEGEDAIIYSSVNSRHLYIDIKI